MTSPPIKIDQLRKLSKDELQAKANSHLAEIETATIEQQATLFSKVDLYVRELERRRDRWVSFRDLILELVIIALILGEVYLGWKQETQQAANFKEQQQVLQNLTNSSKDTANILASLKDTTEAMSTTTTQELKEMKSAAGSSARSAKASEASAETAAKSLHVSERAYLAVVVNISGPPKTGEALRFTTQIRNVGRTTATDVHGTSRFVSAVRTVKQDEDDVRAYKQASFLEDRSSPSNSILSAGQQVEQTIESPAAQQTESLIGNIEADRARFYVFVKLSYKDLFEHEHHIETCSYYDTHSKHMGDCTALNRAD